MKRARMHQWMTLAAGLAMPIASSMAAAQTRVVIETYSPNSTVETREFDAPASIEVAPTRSVPVAERYIEAGPGVIVSPTVSVIPLELAPAADGARKVVQIAEAAGQVWLRSQGGTLFRLDKTSGMVSLVNNVRAEDMAIARDGVVWLAGSEQVSRVAADKVEIFRFDVYVSPEAIALSPDGTVWVGGLSTGRTPILLRLERGIWTAFGPADGLPYLGSIDYLATESSGIVWGGITIEGLPLGEGLREFIPPLVSFDGKQWGFDEMRGAPDVLTTRAVPSRLVVDGSDHVWMVVYGQVVHRDGQQFVVYDWQTAPWGGGVDDVGGCGERGVDRRIQWPVRPIRGRTLAPLGRSQRGATPPAPSGAGNGHPFRSVWPGVGVGRRRLVRAPKNAAAYGGAGDT